MEVFLDGPAEKSLERGNDTEDRKKDSEEKRQNCENNSAFEGRSKLDFADWLKRMHLMSQAGGFKAGACLPGYTVRTNCLLSVFEMMLLSREVV